MFIFFLLLLIVSASALFGAAQNAVVVSASGKVEYKAEGAAWTAANKGTEIPLGSTISTGFNSNAVIEMGSSTLEVKPLTRMRLDKLAEQDGVVSTDLFLRVGRVKAEVKAIEGLQHNFTLKSPVTTASVRGTGFDFDSVNLRVRNGVVKMSNRFKHSSSYKGGESGSSDGTKPPQGGAEGREGDIIVSADTSDILGGGEDTDPTTSRGGASGVGYGSIKVLWTVK
jgi:hypothetical protein